MKKFDIKNKTYFFKKLIMNMQKDNVGEYSAQCSYYTILSFIPFTILLITIIQYTNIDKQTLFDIISKIIPDNMNEFILSLVEEVYSKSIGTISVSIIFTIWSAGKGLYALTKGLHAIYHTYSEKEPSYLYLRLKSLFQIVAFVIIIVLGLILLVFGKSLKSIIQNHFGGMKNFGFWSTVVTQLIFITATFLVFLFVYKVMAKNKTTLKSQICGAIFGAISLNIISFVFSKYLDIFKGFYITYGSLTTLMLIMMWTYTCFYVVFLGAEINKELNNMKKSQKIW